MSIQLHGITKRYGNMVALQPIDLKIDGEICGLIGNNGAGKSTLMKIITGLLQPDAGKLEINGINPKQEPEEAKRQIGYLPESPMLYPRLTPEELLTYIAEVKKVPSPAAEVDRWLTTFGLLEKRRALVRDLSFGMKKKVALSTAFIGAPRLLILDEPFNGLDVATMERLAEMIVTFNQNGATILLSSHLMEYVDRLCRRVLILKRGGVVGEGSPEALKQEAKAASFHQAFLYFTREEK
ncbi:MAG: ABC transporter ATP-binding protein [Nitrospirae bacterium]|nr:ABC transporter ATP-binding protein [Candidatus Manganitrophaceae bacterium]